MITPEYLKTMDYDTFVATLVKDPHEIRKTIDIDKCALLHATLGISGEAGEIIDTIKKHVMYNQPLDRANLKEELGDLFFYFTNLCQEAGFELSAIIEHNREKLTKRYAQGYSDAAAKARADKQ